MRGGTKKGRKAPSFPLNVCQRPTEPPHIVRTAQKEPWVRKRSVTYLLSPAVSVPPLAFFDLCFLRLDICPFPFFHIITPWCSTLIFLHQGAFVYCPLLLGRFIYHKIRGVFHFLRFLSQEESQGDEVPMIFQVTNAMADIVYSTDMDYLDQREVQTLP